MYRATTVAEQEVTAMMWDYGAGWGYWLVTTLLFWGLIVAGIIALIRYIASTRNTGRPRAADEPERPEEVLAHRLARGEIDAQEYKQRLELLRARR
jgi:putative membrane protein